jgi:hypothetical protein
MLELFPVVVIVVRIMFKPLISFMIPAKRLESKRRVISEENLAEYVILLWKLCRFQFWLCCTK